MRLKSLALASALVALTAPAFAQQAPVKLGIVTTLSTPGGYLGEDVRDGILLAIAEEGGKLGGVAVKPLIEDDLDTLFPSGLRLLADPDRGSTIAQVTATAPAERVLVAIGPEGGWVDFERNLLARHGFLGVSMGPRTLRSDTACVALLALVHDALRAHAESAQAFRPATSSSRSGDTAG